MNKNDTFLFDFDGTLVDSMPTYVSVMLNILDEHGITYGSDIVKIITPLGYTGTAKYYRELGIDAPTEELVATMKERALYEYTYRIEAKPEVVDALRELRARGCDLNVLTASPHEALDPCLKRLGLWDLFTNVWSCDDFKTTKSDPQIYLMAAEKIGKAPPEITFIDDNLGAVSVAKSAGMHSVGVYDDSSREYVDEIKRAADGYIYSFRELL